MTQLSLENLTPDTDDTDLTGNGKIFKQLSDKLDELNSVSEDFAGILREAIAKKIWLGFINPSNGRLCSFIAHKEDGSINHGVSFKLWLSAGSQQGGLGIRDLNMIEGVIRSDPKTYQLALPLILDRKEIAEANRIREEQGESPLLRINKTKSRILNILHSAPPEFLGLTEKGLPLEFTSRLASSYQNDYNESEQIEVMGELRKLSSDDDLDKDALAKEVGELLGEDYLKSIRLNLCDPHDSAVRLYNSLGKDMLKELAQELLDLMEEEDDD